MFTCDACARDFSTKRRLATHLRNQRLQCSRTRVGRRQLTDIERENRQIQESKVHGCSSCARKFSSVPALRRHELDSHDNNTGSRDDEIQELRERVDALSARVMNADMSTTNVYNIQNLHLNGFGKEDLSRVTSEFLTACLKQLPNGNKGLLDLVERIHHDTEGNMNVKCLDGDVKDLVMAYYDGDKGRWIIESKSKVIDNMIRRPHSMLNDHFRSNVVDFERELTSALYHFVDHWFSSMRNKKNHVYEDSARRLHAMVKRWGETIMNDIRSEEEEESFP